MCSTLHCYPQACPPPPAVLTLARQLSRITDERGLFRYVSKSLKAFEQVSFAKLLEKGATAGGEEACEDGNRSSHTEHSHQDGFSPDALAGAMMAGLEENILEFGVLAEAVER